MFLFNPDTMPGTQRALSKVLLPPYSEPEFRKKFGLVVLFLWLLFSGGGGCALATIRAIHSLEGSKDMKVRVATVWGGAACHF